MPQTLNILFLAAEAEPFVKVGGLGDVAGSLPRALRELSTAITGDIKLDVRLVLPLHSVVRQDTVRPLQIFSIPRGDSEVQVEAFESTLEGMPVYFITGEPIRASGSVYSSNTKLDIEKYTFFSLAALELTRYLNWTPDILHANDWHTAMVAYFNLAKRWEDRSRQMTSLVEIHNLPFMGPNLKETLAAYRVPLAITDLPDWGRGLPLPLGLWASDMIVTVSPTYAEEILHPEFGCGLENFLQNRTGSLYGVLNGIDTRSFDPSTDTALATPFQADTLSGRARNKVHLQQRVDLPESPDVPLLAMVSRMDPAKGIDIALKGLKFLVRQNWQLVILGAGDAALESMAKKLQQELPDRVRVETRYDARLARQIYGGADVLLMPSRYEPCGISQMLAMRYGCVPLVRAVGGLHDTVTDSETGFVFVEAKIKAFNDSLRRALALYPERSRWEGMQKAGMAEDFSWTKSATRYFEIYKKMADQAFAPSVVRNGQLNQR